MPTDTDDTVRSRTRGGSDPDVPPLPPGGEYAAVSLGSAWGAASLLFFVASLAARQLISFLPPKLQGYYMMPPLVVRLTPALAVVGLVLGLVGLRRRKRRSMALLGVGLNAVVVLLTSLFFIGFWWVRLR